MYTNTSFLRVLYTDLWVYLNENNSIILLKKTVVIYNSITNFKSHKKLSHFNTFLI